MLTASHPYRLPVTWALRPPPLQLVVVVVVVGQFELRLAPTAVSPVVLAPPRQPGPAGVGVGVELYPEACQVVAVGCLTCSPRPPLSGLTHYDGAAAAVEGIDYAGNACVQPAAARSSAVVEHRAAFEAAVAPSVAAVPSAFVIVADVEAAVESLALGRELDASLQTMPAEVAFHSEMSAEREPSVPASAVGIAVVAVAVVANVVAVVVAAAATAAVA